MSGAQNMSKGGLGFKKGSLGVAAGLQIWRIEKMDVAEVDQKSFGSFFAGDCYIVMNVRNLPAFVACPRCLLTLMVDPARRPRLRSPASRTTCTTGWALSAPRYLLTETRQSCLSCCLMFVLCVCCLPLTGRAGRRRLQGR